MYRLAIAKEKSRESEIVDKQLYAIYVDVCIQEHILNGIKGVGVWVKKYILYKNFNVSM